MAQSKTRYEAVIGLEVHAQLLTRSKIFCACSASFGAEPNTHTCPVCLGLPGALPALNRQAVDYAMRMILATDGTINPTSVFARKNYFYPDLPKGYQISQFSEPIGRGGYIEISGEGGPKRIRLIRIHLEEDAGKSLHPEHSGDTTTRIDMNRCGVPLIEIVSEPDIRTPQQAGSYLRKLRQIVEYLGICTGNMEEGALRCDANVSITPAGSAGLGVRTEVKNMNSFRSVERAVEFEINRQIELLEGGGEVDRETLLWDEKSQTAQPMRSKEESSDYRYFPDPDLLPLHIAPDWIEEVRASLPELATARARRLARDYQIPDYNATVLTDQKALADYFEAAVKTCADAKKVSNWIMTEVLRVLKESDFDIAGFPVVPAVLGELLNLIGDGTISGTVAKDVFARMIATGQSAAAIVEAEGLRQVSDDSALIALIDDILRENPEQIESYKGGKTRVFGFFVGEAMKRSKGTANPQRLADLLRERLGGNVEN